MPIDVQRWLTQVPNADEQFPDGIALEGWLIAAEDGEARVLTGGLCLSLSRADIVGIEEVAEEDFAAAKTSAIHVRAVVRRGAPLLDASPAELFDGSIPSRAPFALATRPPVIRTGAMPRFRALERHYLES
jgi:hypothetical protein